MKELCTGIPNFTVRSYKQYITLNRLYFVLTLDLFKAAVACDPPKNIELEDAKRISCGQQKV